MRYSSATGNAHENGNCWPPSCGICDNEHEQAPRLFIEEDAYGDEAVWEKPTRASGSPRLVLYGHDAGDEELWEAIKSLVEGGRVP